MKTPQWIIDAVWDLQELKLCPKTYGSSERLTSAEHIAEKIAENQPLAELKEKITEIIRQYAPNQELIETVMSIIDEVA